MTSMELQEPTNKKRLALAVGAITLTGLLSFLFGWVCDVTFGHEVWRNFVLAHFGLVMGTPMAAALAFGIVIVFQTTSEGPVSIKMGILEITGPAGPILLWVICFLAAIFAITILTPEAGGQAAGLSSP